MKINFFVVYLFIFGFGCGGNSGVFESSEMSSDAKINSDAPDFDSETETDDADVGVYLDTRSDIEELALEETCDNVTFLGVSKSFNQNVEMIQIKTGFVVLWQSLAAIEIRTLNNEGVVISGRQIPREIQEFDPPPQLIAFDDGSSFIVVYKDGEEIYFTSGYSGRGWAGSSSTFRATRYSPVEGPGGWFPIIVQLDDRWMRLGSNGARRVELAASEESFGLSWSGNSLLSAPAKADDFGQFRSVVLEGTSEFVHEWSQAEPYFSGLNYSSNADETGRHAALFGTTVFIEGNAPHILEGVRSSVAGMTPTKVPGEIHWNGESYSVLLLGLETFGEKVSGYFYQVDKNGTQMGEGRKLFSTKNVQHSREHLAFPALVASSPSQLATVWIEDSNQVYFGCFNTLVE